MVNELKGKTFPRRAVEAPMPEAKEEDIADPFQKALDEGYIGPCTVVVTGDSTSTKFRLSSRSVAKARVQAAERGLRYQTYLKMIIHEALRAAESARKPAWTPPSTLTTKR